MAITSPSRSGLDGREDGRFRSDVAGAVGQPVGLAGAPTLAGALVGNFTHPLTQRPLYDTM